MTLYILEVLYHSELLFIPYIYANSIPSESKLLFPTENRHKFAAFNTLNEAQNYFSQLGFNCEQPLITKIDIDHLINWVKNTEPLKMDFDKLIELNSFIFGFILYKDGLLPDEFMDKDFNNMRKLFEICHSKELIKLYHEAKIKYPQQVNLDIKKIKTFSEDEIKETLGNTELKEEINLLLTYFKNHIRYA